MGRGWTASAFADRSARGRLRGPSQRGPHALLDSLEHVRKEWVGGHAGPDSRSACPALPARRAPPGSRRSPRPDPDPFRTGRRSSETAGRCGRARTPPAGTRAPARTSVVVAPASVTRSTNSRVSGPPLAMTVARNRRGGSGRSRASAVSASGRKSRPNLTLRFRSNRTSSLPLLGSWAYSANMIARMRHPHPQGQDGPAGRSGSGGRLPAGPGELGVCGASTVGPIPARRPRRTVPAVVHRRNRPREHLRLLERVRGF